MHTSVEPAFFLLKSSEYNDERRDPTPGNKPPITLDFQVPMFTASGLRIRFLKVWEKSGYNSTKWVRYLCNSGKDTKTGHYEIRCQ